MALSYIDLSHQNQYVEEPFLEKLQANLRQSDFILGPSLTQFEAHCREYFKCRHALGVASGTDALLPGTRRSRRSLRRHPFVPAR